MKNILRAATLTVFALCLSTITASAGAGHKITKAVAVMRPTEGNTTSGIVIFTQVKKGIHVEARITGLTPGKKHGFHIHQFGDISSPDANSAGGHFNPHGAKHGGPESSVRHVGDLGNLEADEQGNATLHLVDKHLKFTGRESIIGRAVIIHEGEDDLLSQPTGAAGDRIAAGVIGVAEPDPKK